MSSFLQLKDNYFGEENEQSTKIFDDVEIVVDPELEDESTVDINDYLGKFILQCRICGNMFPSEEMLDNEVECPICGEVSTNGFMYKGKLVNKKVREEMSPEEQEAVEDLVQDIKDKKDDNQTDEPGEIADTRTFSQFKKRDLSDNMSDIH